MKSKQTVVSYRSIYFLLAGIYLILFLKQDILLYAVFLIIIIYVFTTKAEMSLVLFLSLAPLDRLVVLPNGIFIVAYLMPVIMMRLLYELIILREEISKKNMYMIIVFLVFIVYELSHFIFYPIESISRNILYYSCMAVILLSCIIRPAIRYEKTVMLMTVSIIVGSLISFKTTGLSLLLASSGTLSSRFTMLGEDVNTFGVYLMVVIAANFAILINAEQKKLFTFVSIIGMLFLGLLGVSRGFILNFTLITLLAAAIMFEFKVKHLLRYLGIFIILTLTVLIMSRLAFMQDIYYKYSSRFVGDDLSNGRFDIYRLYIRYVQNHIEVFIYGLGIDNYKGYTQIGYAVHNTLFEMLLSEGVIGISLMLVLTVMVFNEIRLFTGGNTKLFWLPLVALAIGTLTLSLFAITSAYYYLLFGMITLIYNSTRERKSTEAKTHE